MGCKTVTLRDVATLTPGFAFKSRDFGNFDNKVIKITDVADFCDSRELNGVDLSPYLSDKLEKYLVKQGDYYLAMTGSIGKIGRLCKGSAYLNQRVLGVKPKNGVCPTFLWHLLNSDAFKNHLFTHIDSHSVQANISAGSVGEFTFVLPDYSQQKRIAEILDSFDKKLAINSQINGYLAA